MGFGEERAGTTGTNLRVVEKGVHTVRGSGSAWSPDAALRRRHSEAGLRELYKRTDALALPAIEEAQSRGLGIQLDDALGVHARPNLVDDRLRHTDRMFAKRDDV